MQEKTCTKCGETKDVSEFHKNKNRKGGLQTECKACKRAYMQSEKVKQAQRRYRQTEKGKQVRREAERRRQQTEARKQSQREAQRRYKQTEKGKQTDRRQRHARRARKVGAAGFHDFDVALEIYGHKCALCGDTESGLTVGHIIPLSQGGSNWQWNIRPECVSCNCSKGTRLDQELPAEWWDARPDGSEWPTQQV